MHRTHRARVGRRGRRSSSRRPFLLAVMTASLSVTSYSHQTGAQDSRAPAAGAPRVVAINRTVPHVELPPSSPVFSDVPTAVEIRRARVFAEPLVAVGTPSAAENQALARAVTAYTATGQPWAIEPFTSFLREHPSSAWRGSLLVNLGKIHRTSGYLTRALQTWDEAWNLTKDETSVEGRAVADVAAASALEMLATLGHVPGLDRWLARTKERAMRGPAASKADRAREARAIIVDHPDRTIASGPKALEILVQWSTGGTRTGPRDVPPSIPAVLKDFRQTAAGTSLTEVRALAAKVGLSMKAVRREADAPLVTPAIVHLGFDHFSAVLEEKENRFRVRDPALGGEIWMPRDALEQEMTGYALVSADMNAPGWRELSDSEAAVIVGHSCPPGIPDPDECPCPVSEPGMPTYSLHPTQASVLLSDSPLGYSPPRGQAINVQLWYNHREENQPQVFSSANLGARWTLNWLAYLEEVPFTWFNQGGALAFAQPEHVAVHVPQGGVERYVYPTAQGVYPRHYRSAAVLEQVNNNRYERKHADGSKEVYALSDGGSVGTRRFFMTAVIDPHGQSTQLTWDAQLRLVAITDALGQVTTLQYENADPLKITSITDPFGRVARFTYDAEGHLDSITDVINLTSRFIYQDADFISALQTPYGTTSFRKPAITGEHKRAVEAMDPLGAVERLEFHYTNAPVPVTVPAGDVPPGFEGSNSELNTLMSLHWTKGRNIGNVQDATQWRWLIRSMDWFWDPGWTVAVPHSVQSPGVARTWFRYVGLTTRPARVARKLPDGSVYDVNSTYNYQDNVLTTRDPVGREVTYTYAANGIDLLQVRNTTGGRNDVLATYDNYTAGHRPRTITHAAGQTTDLTYNSSGQVLTVTNAKQERTTYAYDPDGYLQTVTGPVTGATVTYAYDAYGRLRSATEAGEAVVTTAYDLLNRPTRTAYGDGTYEETTYDKLDALRQRDRRGRITHYTYNARRQLVATRDPAGRVIQQQWCGCGAVDAVIDANGNATRWERDASGRVLREVRADGATDTDYSYDALGRLKTVTDPKQQVTTLSYNLDGSLAAVAYTNAQIPTSDVAWTYDPAYRRLVSMADGTGTTTYTYKGPGQLGAGRLATLDGPLSNDVISYDYDQLGRVLTRAVNGVGMTFTYDALGRVERVVNALGTFDYTFDAVSSRVATVTYPNSQTTAYTYFPAAQDHRLQQILHRYPGGTTLSQSDYTYDVVGNILTWRQQTDTTAVIWDYGYDSADQLVRAVKRATDPQGTILQRFAYGYDPAGNRLFEQVDDTVTTSAYDRLNRLVSQQAGGFLRVAGSVNEPANVRVQGLPASVDAAGVFVSGLQTTAGTTRFTVTATDASGNVSTQSYDVDQNGTPKAFTYDSNGNMTSDGTRQYDWDARNHLVGIRQGAGTLASFTYNGEGLRTSKTAGGTTTSYVLAEGTAVEERRSTGGVIAHIPGPGVDNLLGSLDGTIPSFYVTDHLGSVRRQTNAAAQVVHDRDYDPWGTMSAGESAAGWSYTGREWDPEIGLYYYRARFYDPRLGRFIGEDPARADRSGNLYAYVDNEPTIAVDPSGMIKIEVCARPLQKKYLGINFSRIWNHTYIRVTYDNGTEATFGILGNPGSSENQIPRTADQGGRPGPDGQPTDRNSNDGKHTYCKEVPADPCQVKKLLDGIKAALDAGTCPSCGDNYDRWKPLFDGYNSNTWVYNMIQGAGLTPPPMPRSPGYHSAPGAWYPK